MSPRQWRFCVQDILEATRRIQRYVAGMDLERFADDEKTQDAVVRQFILMGEAVRHIPSQIVRKYDYISWQDIRAMRNFTVHVYWGVEPQTVWTTILEDLPVLAEELQALLEREREEQ